MNRIIYIDTLRVIASILVIFVHVSSMFISSQELHADEDGYVVYKFTHVFCSMAINLFLMISGVLLLSRNNGIPYSRVFSRYIYRIVLALLIFGFPMCLLEQFMQPNGDGYSEMIMLSVANLLTGNCWTHMWYLYMLIGLYMILPVLSSFFVKNDKAEQRYLIIGLILFGVIIPSAKSFFDIQVTNYIEFNSYVAIFALGYYIHNHIRSDRKAIAIASVVSVLYIVFCFFKVHYGSECYGPTYFSSVVFAGALLVIIRRFPLFEVLSGSLAKHCFCLYLVHPIFLNIFFKIIHVERMLTFHSAINMCMVFLVTFGCSFMLSVILHKIPFLSQKVL